MVVEVKRILLALYLVLLCGLTYRRVTVWVDNRSVWTDAVATAPCSARAHWNLSQAWPEGSAERLSALQAAALVAMREDPRCR